MRDCFDVKIFVDPEEELRIQWKIKRDMSDRGYTYERISKQIEERNEYRFAYVLPQRAFADVVIEFARSEWQHGDDGYLGARHILRPTIPHPDLPMPRGDTSADGGIRQHMARDADSKPVDILDISGAISDDQACQLEGLLWELMPDAHELRPGIGEYFAGSDRLVSHPVVLSQLLAAFHFTEAKEDTHAV